MPSPSKNLVLWTAMVAGIASLSFNGYFLWQRSERDRIDRLSDELSIGTIVRPFSGKSVGGASTRISFDSATIPTVLYVLAPDCRWCQRNADVVRESAEQTRGRYRFIGISIKKYGLAAYLGQYPLPFDVVIPDDESVFQTLRIRAVPRTIVLSPEGKVLAVVQGAFGGTPRRRIEDTFGVRLTRQLTSGASE